VPLGTFPTRADADAALATQQVELAKGTWMNPTGQKLKFGEWVNEWKTTTVDLRLSTRVRDLGYVDRYILPHFRHLCLGDIGYMTICNWIAGLSNGEANAGKPLAPATVVKASQIMGKIMKSAVLARKIPSSPCEGTPRPRIEREEMRFLNPAEVRNLSDTMDHRYRAAVLLAAYGGLRMGEVWGLRTNYVDLEKSSVRIVEIVTDVGGHLVVGPPKTRSGHRTIPLPRVAADALRDHLEQRAAGPNDLVFPAPHGGLVSLNQWRTRFWRPAVTSAGLSPLRPHDLRHTAVALWIAAGANPLEVKTRAGVTSVAFILDRYGHLFPGSEERVNDALDALAASASDRAQGAPAAGERRDAPGKKTPLTLINGSGRRVTRTPDLSRVKAAL